MKIFFRCIFIFIVIFSLNKNCIAQSSTSISGKVTDLISGDVITGATIYISNLDKGTRDSITTNGSGVWAYNFAAASVADDKLLPSQFYVSQNYPNPFNPTTKIDVSIPESGNVTVAVYNMLGELVDKREEFISAGNYTIEWSARGSAGVYFLNVKTKNNSSTRKMILLDRCSGAGLSSLKHNGSISPAGKYLPKSSLPVLAKIQIVKFAYVTYTQNIVINGGENFDTKLETFHSLCTVADLHNDVLEVISATPTYHLSDLHTTNHTDIPRLTLGGVDVQIFSVWVDPTKFAGGLYKEANNMINLFNNEMALNTTKIGQAFNRNDVITLNNQKKIAAILIVEGGHTIENDLEKLKALYNAGMRYFTITWNNSTDWAVSAQDSRTSTLGLSEFGKTVIKTLDSLGVIIDISHTGIKTIQDILAITKNPIIASHSGVRALRNHYRDLTDDQIKAIAASGGVIGVVFYPPFLTTGTATIATVANHIDYIKKLVGVDYIALGSDFDGIETVCTGLENVSKFPALTLELLKRGYTQEELRKILGENFLRVFDKVCTPKAR